MSWLITPHHQELIDILVKGIPESYVNAISHEFEKLIDIIHRDIPEKKRISTGRYSIVKILGEELYSHLERPG